MPIYEYQCQDCQEKFELLVLSSSKADDVECPRCHSRNVRRMISLFGRVSSGGSSSSVSSSCPSYTGSG
ncbi:MAG: zinc ribbon domain-containing protein [Chloroflexi bacterium]|nr:MAG: zinc ribbon domain-containing protein [Chloroflexota bacterium]